jgi:type VI secretion system secreted protein VgrG
MSPTLQTHSPNRLLQVASTSMQSLLTVTAMVGADFVSAPFSFDVTARINDASYTLSDFIMHPLCISIYNSETQKQHFIHGIIDHAFNLEHPDEIGLTIKPWLAQLQYTEDCRSYQNLSITEIVQTIFKEHHFFDFDLSQLLNSYPKIPYTVQYNESYFHFISRLLEQVGIFYYFSYTANKHIMHLCDHVQKTPQLESSLVADNTHGFFGDHVYDWYPSASLTPNTYSNGDYNPALTSPLLNTTRDSKDPSNGTTDIKAYHYPGDYKCDAQASSQIDATQHAAHAAAHTISGKTNSISVQPGHRFRLNNEDKNTPYFVTERRINIEKSYHSHFSCVDTHSDYAPMQTHKKPTLPGLYIAQVTGATDTELYHNNSAHIKAQFYWDQHGSWDQNSSPWLRVAQNLAGENAGHLFLPRVGDEAVVLFMDENPDRPQVIGSAYNSAHAPAYALPYEKSSSGFKTKTVQGSRHNEFTFSDQSLQEAVYINAAHNLSTLVTNNAIETINGTVTTTLHKGDHNSAIINGTSDITANNTVVFKVKGSTLEITPRGVHINAPAVMINPSTTQGTTMPSQKPNTHNWLSATCALRGLIAGITAHDFF